MRQDIRSRTPAAVRQRADGARPGDQERPERDGRLAPGPAYDNERRPVERARAGTPAKVPEHAPSASRTSPSAAPRPSASLTSPKPMPPGLMRKSTKKAPPSARPPYSAVSQSPACSGTQRGRPEERRARRPRAAASGRRAAASPGSRRPRAARRRARAAARRPARAGYRWRRRGRRRRGRWRSPGGDAGAVGPFGGPAPLAPGPPDPPAEGMLAGALVPPVLPGRYGEAVHGTRQQRPASPRPTARRRRPTSPVLNPPPLRCSTH